MSRLVFFSTCLFLLCCVALGGGTTSGLMATTLLEILALGLLGLLMLSHGEAARRLPWYYYAFWLLPIVYALVQLVPLPPAIWTMLPGHGLLIDTYKVIGEPLPWAPISMLPHATRLTMFELVPAATMFLLTLNMNDRQRLGLILVCVGAIIFSDLLGLLQYSQGASSQLRFHAETTLLRPVGFFANSNHMAAALYTATAFGLTGLAIMLKTSAATTSSLALIPNNIITKTLIAVACIGLISTQILTKSRMGNALTLLAIFLAVASAMQPDARSHDKNSHSGWVFTAIGVIALAIAVIFGLEQFLERFNGNQGINERGTFALTSWRAALNYLPFGSGLGSFDRIYETFETRDSINAFYVNHAHNDYVELFLETGLFGLLWAAAFILWWLLRTIQLWRHAQTLAFEHQQDWMWARAGSSVVGLLLIHSFVDYTLRTETMSAIFGLATALMIPSLVERHQPHHSSGRRKTRKSGSAPLPIGLGKSPAPQSDPQPVHWPEAWK